MAQALSTINPRLGLVPAERGLIDLLAWYSNGISSESGETVTDRVPAPDHRRALEARDDQLRASLSAWKSERQGIGERVAELMLAFNQARKIGEDDARKMAAKFVEVLQGLPLWAVRRACDRIERNQIEGVSLDFPPSAPRLREVALRELTPFYEEQAKIRTVLLAKPLAKLTPAEQERLTAAVTAWLDRTDPKAQRMIQPPTESPLDRASEARAAELAEKRERVLGRTAGPARDLTPSPELVENNRRHLDRMAGRAEERSAEEAGA